MDTIVVQCGLSRKFHTDGASHFKGDFWPLCDKWELENSVSTLHYLQSQGKSNYSIGSLWSHWKRPKIQHGINIWQVLCLSLIWGLVNIYNYRVSSWCAAFGQRTQSKLRTFTTWEWKNGFTNGGYFRRCCWGTIGKEDGTSRATSGEHEDGWLPMKKELKQSIKGDHVFI